MSLRPLFLSVSLAVFSKPTAYSALQPAARAFSRQLSRKLSSPAKFKTMPRHGTQESKPEARDPNYSGFYKPFYAFPKGEEGY